MVQFLSRKRTLTHCWILYSYNYIHFRAAMALNQPFLAMAQQLLSQMSSDSPNQPGNINALMQLHLATQLASNVRQGSTDETTASELDSDEIKSELDSSEQSKTDGENNMDEDRGDDMSSLILNNTLAGISPGQRVFQCELCDKAFTQGKSFILSKLLLKT